jgi:hypothetical protein
MNARSQRGKLVSAAIEGHQVLSTSLEQVVLFPGTKVPLYPGRALPWD